MNRKAFFDAIRRPLFNGSMSVEQVRGTEAKIDAFEKAGWPIAWAAYGLATSYHETAHTMQPVAEYGKGRGRKYGVKAGPYGHVYYGRGDVQLTWLFNYEKAGKAIGADLVRYPDLALEPEVSARVMVEGMQDGWFTGKANRHYLNSTIPDYVGARRIINGTDKATMIAGYARHFERALRLAGYDGKPDAPQKPANGPPAAKPPSPAPSQPTPATQPRKGLFSWLKGVFRNG